MENNNDIHEVRHTPRGFSGYYIQIPVLNPLLKDDGTYMPRLHPLLCSWLHRGSGLGTPCPLQKNKNENTITMLWGCFSGSRNFSEVVWWLQTCSTAIWTFSVNKCVSNNFITEKISDCLLVWVSLDVLFFLCWIWKFHIFPFYQLSQAENVLFSRGWWNIAFQISSE